MLATRSNGVRLEVSANTCADVRMCKGVELPMNYLNNGMLKWCKYYKCITHSNIRFSNCISGKCGEAIDQMPVRLLRPCNILYRLGGGVKCLRMRSGYITKLSIKGESAYCIGHFLLSLHFSDFVFSFDIP